MDSVSFKPVRDFLENWNGGELVNLKPMSVNECWVGKQRPTAKFGQYKKDLTSLLTGHQWPDLAPENGDTPLSGNRVPPLSKTLFMEYGMSNTLSDVDGPIKVTQDIIADKFQFNDREIDLLVVRKIKVKKGDEYVRYYIEPNGINEPQ